MENVQRRNNLYGLEFLKPDLRRAPEGERKTYEIKSMWQRTHEIVNLSVRGFKNVAIAEILGIDPQTVSNTLNSELGEKKLSEMRLERDEETKKVSEKIRVLTNQALEVYRKVFNDPNVTTKEKLAAADTVTLELSGLRAPTKVQTASIHTVLTKDEIAEFKERGMQAARECGVIVDAETISETDRDEN